MQKAISLFFFVIVLPLISNFASGQQPTAPPNIVINVNPPSNNSTKNSKNSTANMANDPCVQKFNQAAKDCGMGGTAAQMAMMMQMGAGGMGVMAGAGGPASAYSACKAMQMQATTALAGGAMVAGVCTTSINSCRNSCNYQNASYNGADCHCTTGGQVDPDMVDGSDGNNNWVTKGGQVPDQCRTVCSVYVNDNSSCKGLQTQTYIQAGMSGLQGVMGFMSASQCEALVAAQEDGQCTGANANSFTCNPAVACAQNPSTPGCPANLAVICANPATAAGNPMCPNSAMDAALPALPSNPAGDETQGALWNGYQASNQNPAGAGGDSGGPPGGLPMGGGGAYPGGPNAAPGPGYQGGGLKSDVGGGVGGGGASGNVTMGNPTNGTSGGAKGSGLDLSQFLPGGAIAANRALASVNNGITGANELSNFEKITRMMNQKRKFLIPP